MKKHIEKWSLLILTAFFAASCNDEFLERKPLDEVSSETFWNSENDLQVYNNSLYDLARNDDNVPILMGHYQNFESYFGSIWFQDEFSDNMAPRHDRHTFFQQVRAGKHNIPTDPQWFGYKGWNFVRAVNVGLANYSKAPLEEEVINKYAAEARLFRGWFYAEKVQKFGDVPWVDKPLDTESEELYAARTPREEAMLKVLEDLSFAAENLPDDWEDGNAPGRLNRWCALLVKSRVCLYEGTWRKYHGGSDAEMWLREAANAAKEIMDNGPYSLYNTGDPENDYNAYHRSLDLSGNPEVMYWRKYQLGVLTNHVQSYFEYAGGATKSLVEDYLCTDGLPVSLSPLYQGDAQIEDVFVNRDPRLRQTVLHPEDAGKYQYHLADGRPYPRLTGMSGGYRSTTGYHIIKHYNAADMIGKAYNTAESPAIILRFGEVLLNYAEALAELGELSQQDLDISINLLRDRVAMPHMVRGNVPADPRYTADGVPPLIVEIRRERRVELFMEGHRYKDLKRWKQGKKLEIPAMGIRWDAAAITRYPGATVQSSVDPLSGNTYIDVYKGTDWENPVFDESKHYLWPVPLSSIAQNPNLGQNPGW
ncbi:putative outer membrane starch-binding protein [Anseongella ginsenosidimutans]|uniref:Putative outer membrane starch-binding protein n=1 Tax=Anseongella ginsenosidimutans TaxID=496056 RepID=A0A4R3KU40_9SPHI|nr:RagB/SusD family nutrient uptake outer membrane protein [Anseongella ginsenosidimutans]QEC53293.1 RagB/SusD family nutrient uptake outer membrane protein [Anseongella ginsenosidimutans]TCS88165.1 putative outer membrane starch-binding protein [Anseongella ginsenosidimutans]